MSKSIMQKERECYVCHIPYFTHKHHIYEGTANRKKSEQDGCWVYLCYFHHNGSNEGIHFNKELEMRLKRECQEKWENKYGDREDFIRRFGKSYL